MKAIQLILLGAETRVTAPSVIPTVVGRRIENTPRRTGYTLFDLGAAYTTSVLGNETTIA